MTNLEISKLINNLFCIKGVLLGLELLKDEEISAYELDQLQKRSLKKIDELVGLTITQLTNTLNS